MLSKMTRMIEQQEFHPMLLTGSIYDMPTSVTPIPQPMSLIIIQESVALLSTSASILARQLSDTVDIQSEKTADTQARGRPKTRTEILRHDIRDSLLNKSKGIFVPPEKRQRKKFQKEEEKKMEKTEKKKMNTKFTKYTPTYLLPTTPIVGTTGFQPGNIEDYF